MSQEKPGTSGEPENTPAEQKASPEADKASKADKASAPATSAAVTAAPADEPAPAATAEATKAADPAGKGSAVPAPAADLSSTPVSPAPSGSTPQPGYGAAAGYGLAGAASEASVDADEPAYEYTVKTPSRAGGSSLVAQFGAELFGSFVMILAGLGALLYASYTGLGVLGVALAFGLAAAAAHLALGRVSGGHFNPMITLGAALAGRVSPLQMVCYWVAQFVGSVAAAAVVYLPMKTFSDLEPLSHSFFSGTANGFGAHSPLALTLSQNYSTTGGFASWTALLIEAVLTAILVGVFLAATNRPQPGRTQLWQSAAAYGATLTVAVMVATPVTNAGLNPARSLASAIFAESWVWGQYWVFLLGPVIGAVIAGGAAVLAKYMNEPDLGAFDDDLEDDLEDDVDASYIVEDESGHTIVLDERP